MKASAVVYTSNTGFTARYARALGERTGLPVLELGAALRDLPQGSPVAYLGWLCAGSVKGLKQAEDRWALCAVCAVGMGPDDTQVEDLKGRYPGVFYLRGGYDYQKLTGVYRFMMWCMTKVLGKKAAKDPQGAEMAAALRNGGDWVDLSALDAVAAALTD